MKALFTTPTILYVYQPLRLSGNFYRNFSDLELIDSKDIEETDIHG
jgi:hypothetical protein